MENQNYNHMNNEQRNCLKCDVCNCVYNDQHCGCLAKQVIVGPNFATSQNDTVCGTFKKSQN